METHISWTGDFKPDGITLGVLKIVAVEGDADDWAAYYGDMSMRIVEIAAHGIKLPKEIAEALFPALALKYTYRE